MPHIEGSTSLITSITRSLVCTKARKSDVRKRCGESGGLGCARFDRALSMAVRTVTRIVISFGEDSMADNVPLEIVIVGGVNLVCSRWEK